ncbi:MAG: MogA/MoaB family molybdenum cofactor biosynthesis protein, partial [Bryobacteraceae bacterium]
MNAAVLTVSDSAHAGTREDLSGPAVRLRLEQLGWQAPVLEVVPDDEGEIAARLVALADSGRFHAIFTTGGTGIAARDVTPEATRSVLDREIPGVAERMRAKGSESTPRAALS